MKTFKRIMAFVMTAALVFSVCASMFSFSAATTDENKTLSWEEAYRIVAMISGETDMNKWDAEDRNLFYGLMFGTLDYYEGYLPGVSVSNLQITAKVNEKYATFIAPRTWWLGDVTYQWQTWTETFYGYGTWTDIEGETNSTLIVVAPKNDAKYRVVLTTSDGAKIATQAYSISGLADIAAPEVVVKGYAVGNLFRVYVTVSDASGIAAFKVDGESQLVDKSIPKTANAAFYMNKVELVKIEVEDTQGNKDTILVYVNEGEVKTSQDWFNGGDIGYNPGYDIAFPTYSDLTPTLKSHTAKEAVIEGVAIKYMASFMIAYQWQIKGENNVWYNVKGATSKDLTVANPVEGASYRLVYTSRYDGKFIVSPVITIPALTVEEEPKDEPIVDKDFTVEDIVVAGIVEKATVGDALVLVPNPVDGTWVYDEAYFSGLTEGITVLEALKEGVTVLKYQVERNGKTYEKAFIVVIEAAKVVPEVGTSDN